MHRLLNDKIKPQLQLLFIHEVGTHLAITLFCRTRVLEGLFITCCVFKPNFLCTNLWEPECFLNN